MAEISDVLIIDVSGIVTRRTTKHCVCISVSQDKYFLINTNHRKFYDDFEIMASDYDFLGDTNRFVCCSEIFGFEPERVIRKVGNLNYGDMAKIINKIQKSRILDKRDKDYILHNLGKWLTDNT